MNIKSNIMNTYNRLNTKSNKIIANVFRIANDDEPKVIEQMIVDPTNLMDLKKNKTKCSVVFVLR